MKIYRKRLFPDETIFLKDDKLVYSDEKIIVTKWDVLKPKIHLHHGISCYFLEEGCKVSKFYSEDNSLLYWYCDIAKYDYNDVDDELLFTDLLADVVIYPDGHVQVVDLAEAADILEEGKISAEDICKMLRNLEHLLQKIYSGEFEDMKRLVELYE